MRCGDCKFYAGKQEQCRRHPPKDTPVLDFHNSELLRDIAWSMRIIADVEEPGQYHTLSQEASEVADSCRWPYTDSEDWCGEFVRSDTEALK